MNDIQSEVSIVISEECGRCTTTVVLTIKSGDLVSLMEQAFEVRKQIREGILPCPYCGD